MKRSKFDTGPAASKTSRQVFSSDVENPRHVIDRAESNNTGYRSAKLNQRLWPGGVVPYRLDSNFGKSS